MERRLITGHSPFEASTGFSRAVVAGDVVYVSGTAPIPPGGMPAPTGAYDQAHVYLALIGEALERAGSSLAHVVRTRMFITDAADWPEIARAHGETFTNVRPAATAVVVAELLDSAWKVEIEADAIVPMPTTT